ncbi:hypothetical protein SAMD00019534_026300 [Acytostelium subglobosum LB1]|uniref:hypothetical protein n=1 Tax=Acytostelium subglobosum LB1 TaxID=1410327 RepID=UPI000644FDA6|nr:hypothetical protein SAMD00019534_026300 [Acytostelium subglobosum LB1]GAM19455.1 hypothetical protein SAMD00019534_026300 [Acytostelium subglobosum LB1]|eukprot:XP_012757382.1 hypothetical protein SAMD00019534_026300 [Acytostelium subglobosum LB1]
MPRFNELWKTLEHCVASYQTLEETNSSITEHFQQLLKLIVAQEHQAKKTINEKKELIQSTINNIIKETNNINHIIDPSLSSLSSNNNNNNDEDDVSQMISLFTSCTSVDQFINNSTQITLANQSSKAEDGTSDHELLSMIINHIKHTQQVPYDDQLRSTIVASRVNTDAVKLNDIKKQLESCFKLINDKEEAPKVVAKEPIRPGHILSLSSTRSPMLSLQTMQWTQSAFAFKTNGREFIASVMTASVFARRSVYLFGGSSAFGIYTRLSLADNQLHEAPMDGIAPARMITACYDGDKNIYLIGGFDIHDHFINRVDCLNIDTQQFSHVGSLLHVVGEAAVYFNKGKLIILGGETSPHYHLVRNIISYDVNTQATEVLAHAILNNPDDPSCFDGGDNIYILTGESFIRFTLSTRETAILTRKEDPPINPKKRSRLFYDPSLGIIIVVKVAVQSLVDLSISVYSNSALRINIFSKLLEIIQSPLIYRKAVVRAAVSALGVIVCHEESLVNQTITFLAKILEFKGENLQYLKRVCIGALGRIGRRYPVYQNTLLIPMLERYFDANISSQDVVCAILVTFGRFSQTNSELRVMCMSRWLEAIDNTHHLFKSAGIHSLGYASCPTANVVNDKEIEALCYSKAIGLLQYHKMEDYKGDDESDPWKKEEVYQVQVAATKALGLLARSNPNEWLPKLAKIFKAILSSPRYQGAVKAAVLYIYGQVTYYLNSTSSPYFTPLKVLLFELSADDNPTVSAPSCYALSKFGLSHETNYLEVKTILRMKIANIQQAKPETLVNYLKTWCKIVSKTYRPILNQCSSIISPLYADLYSIDSNLAKRLPLLKNKMPIGMPHGVRPPKLQDHMGLLETAFGNYQHLQNLCHCFSPVVTQAILTLIKKPALFDHNGFRKALRDKILIQRNKGFMLTGEENYEPVLKELSLDISKRKAFIQVLKQPELLLDKPRPEKPRQQQEQQPQQQQQSIVIQMPAKSLQFKPHASIVRQKAAKQDTPATSSTSQPTPPSGRSRPFWREEEYVGSSMEQRPMPTSPRSVDSITGLVNRPSSSPALLFAPLEQIPMTPPSEDQQPITSLFAPLPLISTESSSATTSTTPTSSLFTPLAPIEDTSSTSNAFKPLPLIDETQSSPLTIQDQDHDPSAVQGNDNDLDIDNNNDGHEQDQEHEDGDAVIITSSSDTEDDDDDEEDDEMTLTIDDDQGGDKSTQTSTTTNTILGKRSRSLLDHLEEDSTLENSPDAIIARELANETDPQRIKTINKKLHTFEKDFNKRMAKLQAGGAKNNTAIEYQKANYPAQKLSKFKKTLKHLKRKETRLANRIAQGKLSKNDKKNLQHQPQQQHNNNNNNNNQMQTKQPKQPKQTKQQKQQKSSNKKQRTEPNNLYVGINFEDRPRVQPICQFYSLGMCNKGAECTFRHEGPIEERKVGACKFLKMGSCLKGAECPFSHDLKQEPCRFFNLPIGCTKKDDCPYGHFISPEFQQKLKQESIEYHNNKQQQLQQQQQYPQSHDHQQQLGVPPQTQTHTADDNIYSDMSMNDIRGGGGGHYMPPTTMVTSAIPTLPMSPVNNMLLPPHLPIMSTPIPSTSTTTTSTTTTNQPLRPVSSPVTTTTPTVPVFYKRI